MIMKMRILLIFIDTFHYLLLNESEVDSEIHYRHIFLGVNENDS
jgi:hypothetical protein